MPIIVFGESAGMIGGDHKDTFVYAGGANSAWGSEPEIYSGGGGNAAYSIGRWSFDGHIPTNVVINSAIATYVKRLAAGPALAANLSYNNILTPSGVTPTDAGVNQNPPVGANDAATWNDSFAVTGTNWAGGGAISAADIGVMGPTVAINQNDPIGTVYNFDITDIVQAQVQNDATNFGWIISQTGAFYLRLWSLNAAVLANRPYLTVNWDFPPSTGITRQSHTAIHTGIAMM